MQRIALPQPLLPPPPPPPLLAAAAAPTIYHTFIAIFGPWPLPAGSRGIGAEFVRQFVQKGNRVIAGCRCVGHCGMGAAAANACLPLALPCLAACS